MIETTNDMPLFPGCCWLCYQADQVATAPFYRIGSLRVKPANKRTNVTVYICSDCRDTVLDKLDAPKRLTYDNLKAQNAELRAEIKRRDDLDTGRDQLVDAVQSLLASGVLPEQETVSE